MDIAHPSTVKEYIIQVPLDTAVRRACKSRAEQSRAEQSRAEGIIAQLIVIVKPSLICSFLIIIGYILICKTKITCLQENFGTKQNNFFLRRIAITIAGVTSMKLKLLRMEKYTLDKSRLNASF